MNLIKKKKQIITKLAMIGTTLIPFFINGNICLATGIGTAEVQTATENIKRVITSIAMPLRWSSYFCKCSCSCNKNDCKCK